MRVMYRFISTRTNIIDFKICVGALSGLLLIALCTSEAKAVCLSFQYVALLKSEQRQNENFRPGTLTNNNANNLEEKNRTDNYCFDESKAWLQSEPEYPYPRGKNITQNFTLPTGQNDRIVSSYSISGRNYNINYRARIDQPGQQSFIDRIIGYSFYFDGSSCRLNKVVDNYIMVIRTSGNFGNFTGFRLVNTRENRCSIL